MNLLEVDELAMRVGIIVNGDDDQMTDDVLKAGLRTGFGDEWLRIVGIEWCPDCSTSGRTAAYYEPYVGEAVPGEPVPNTGMLLYDADDLRDKVVRCHGAGLRVCVEGVGDRGIDFALDAIEAALKSHPKDDHRSRVEHCCYVTPPLVKRLKDLDVTDSSATGLHVRLGRRLPQQPWRAGHGLHVAAPQPHRRRRPSARPFRRQHLLDQPVAGLRQPGQPSFGFRRATRQKPGDHGDRGVAHLYDAGRLGQDSRKT